MTDQTEAVLADLRGGWIALAIEVTLRTVEYHLSNVYAKLTPADEVLDTLESIVMP